MSRKFVFYLRGISRGIVLTDSNQNITTDAYAEQISELLADKNICEFKTSTDCLIVRPTDIQGIHIQGGPFKSKGINEDSDKIGKEKDSLEFIDDINMTVPEIDLDIEDEDGGDVELEEVKEDLIIDEEEATSLSEEEDRKEKKEEANDTTETDIVKEVESWHQTADVASGIVIEKRETGQEND